MLTPRPSPSVAIFASSFHPHLGGVEELVRQLAHQQQFAGGSPTVFTMRWPKTLPSSDSHEAIPVERHVFRLPERKPRWLVAYALENHRIQRTINEQVVRHGADLVHVQCVSGNGWYAYRAARTLGLPLVVTLQGELTMDANRVYETSSVLPKLLRRLLLEADAITACSRHTLEEAQEFTGVDLGERGHVVPNGVNLDEIRRGRPVERARPYVLAIGRHVREKGFDVLLHAWKQVRAALPVRVDLVVAGDGPEHESLQRLANELDLSECVQFPGRCDRVTTASLFAGCTAFVLPSRHEPFGIVTLEAMAAGKTVVASRVGGVPEIVSHDRNGLLVPPEDQRTLAVALVQILSTPADTERLGRQAFADAAKFDWPLIAARYADVYDQARSQQQSIVRCEP